MPQPQVQGFTYHLRMNEPCQGCVEELSVRLLRAVPLLLPGTSDELLSFRGEWSRLFADVLEDLSAV